MPFEEYVFYVKLLNEHFSEKQNPTERLERMEEAKTYSSVFRK